MAPISPICAIPFAIPSDELAPKLVREAGVLLLPATMFYPEGEPRGRHQLRVAFANVDRPGITIGLFDRLAALGWPLAPTGDNA